MKYAAVIISRVRVEFDAPSPGPNVVEEGLDAAAIEDVYEARVAAAQHADGSIVDSVTAALGELGSVVEVNVEEVAEVAQT